MKQHMLPRHLPRDYDPYDHDLLEQEIADALKRLPTVCSAMLRVLTAMRALSIAQQLPAGLVSFDLFENSPETFMRLGAAVITNTANAEGPTDFVPLLGMAIPRGAIPSKCWISVRHNTALYVALGLDYCQSFLMLSSMPPPPPSNPIHTPTHTPAPAPHNRAAWWTT
jgi:hypothetical protein